MKVSDPVRVVIISSNSFVRVGLLRTFEAHSGITIAGEAASSTSLRDVVEQGRPDLIVLDLDSDMKVADIIGKLRQSAPRAQIVLLVDWTDIERGRQGLELGADVIMMTCQPADILLAIVDSMSRRAAFQGSTTNVAPKKVNPVHLSTGKSMSPSAPLTDSLTGREREVVSLVSKGLSNRDMAERLCITETTVRHHLTSIFDKLGVSNRQKLLLLAHQHGLTEISASA